MIRRILILPNHVPGIFYVDYNIKWDDNAIARRDIPQYKGGAKSHGKRNGRSCYPKRTLLTQHFFVFDIRYFVNYRTRPPSADISSGEQTA